MAPEDKYEIVKKVEDAALVISSESDPKIEVTVTLTSPLMRTAVGTEQNGGTDVVAAAGGKIMNTRVLSRKHLKMIKFLLNIKIR